MSSPESDTYWIGRLQAADPDAAQYLWERYYQRLVRLARKKLQGSRRRVADEEDVALSAFASFCDGAAAGRYPQLHDRQNLWALLVQITVRKAGKLVRQERRKKRGGGQVRGESVFCNPKDSGPEGGLEQIAGREPTPEFAYATAQECQRLLDLLDSPELCAVALWKLEGYTNAEIAAKLGCVEGTVSRKLRMIRSIWEQENAPWA
jgi:RNA polymerase sigma factor (sigma-70 family)